MNKLDLMSQEHTTSEVVDIIKEEVDKLAKGTCADCPFPGEFGHGCSGCMTTYLNSLKQEVEMVPRIALIHTLEDCHKTHADCAEYCRNHECATCKYAGKGQCFDAWLFDLVPKDSKI